MEKNLTMCREKGEGFKMKESQRYNVSVSKNHHQD